MWMYVLMCCLPEPQLHLQPAQSRPCPYSFLSLSLFPPTPPPAPPIHPSLSPSLLSRHMDMDICTLYTHMDMNACTYGQCTICRTNAHMQDYAYACTCNLYQHLHLQQHLYMHLSPHLNEHLHLHLNFRFHPQTDPQG